MVVVISFVTGIGFTIASLFLTKNAHYDELKILELVNAITLATLSAVVIFVFLRAIYLLKSATAKASDEG